MRLLNVRKKRPLNVRKMRLLTKCFAPICWIANYSEDNVNHPSNNQGQVFWTQRRQYCYVVLPVPFLLGWLFGSMSCRFLYTHPTTTDPKKGKSMYFPQAIKQINPMSAGFGSKACENLWAVLREKLRQRCLKKKTYTFNSRILRTFNSGFLRTFNSRNLPTFNSRILWTLNSRVLRTFNGRLLQTYNSRIYEH